MVEILKNIWEIKGTLFFLVLLLFGFVAFHTYQHEEVHKAIYNSYGIEAEIDYQFENFFLLKSTMAVTKAKESCSGQCRELHIQNEIYGYNTITIVFILFAILSYLILRDRINLEFEMHKINTEHLIQ